MSDPGRQKSVLFVLEPEPSPGDGERGAPCRLVASECSCGAILFPPQSHGCERCGSVSSTRVEIDASGVLLAVATVYVHPKLPAPYQVGRVVLDRGPAIDVRLEPSAAAVIGARVRGRVYKKEDASGESAECRFTVEGSKS